MRRILMAGAAVFVLAACDQQAATETADAGNTVETADDTGDLTATVAEDVVETAAADADDTQDAPEEAAIDNVLLAEWTGPYGGVPAFDDMDVALVKPALEEGMARSLAEYDAIANNPDAPTFDNTIVGDGGRVGRRPEAACSPTGASGAARTCRRRSSARSSSEMAPKLAEYSVEDHPERGALRPHPGGLRGRGDATSLDPAGSKASGVARPTTGSPRNGATLEGEARERYAEINAEVWPSCTRSSPTTSWPTRKAT